MRNPKLVLVALAAAACAAGSASAAQAGSQSFSGKLCILKQSQLPMDVGPACVQHKTVRNSAVTLWSATWGSAGSSLASTHTLTIQVFRPTANPAAQTAAFKKEASAEDGAKPVKIGSFGRVSVGPTGVAVAFVASGYDCQLAFTNYASPTENLPRAGEIVALARVFAARLK